MKEKTEETELREGYSDPVYTDKEPQTWKEAIEKVRAENPNADPGIILNEAIRRYGYLRRIAPWDRRERGNVKFPVTADKVPPKLNRVKEFRQKRGWTQSELVLKSCVSITTISRLESTPLLTASFDIAENLAFALGVKPSELFPNMK